MKTSQKSSASRNLWHKESPQDNKLCQIKSKLREATDNLNLGKLSQKLYLFIYKTFLYRKVIYIYIIFIYYTYYIYIHIIHLYIYIYMTFIYIYI